MEVFRRDDQALNTRDRREVSVGLEVIVLAAIGTWSAMVLLVISLCRAAKWGDDAMDSALAQAIMEPPPADQTLRTLALADAAALLDVSPETLLGWETRYGFPTSSASERRYNRSEVLALRDSISDGISIASAVVRARERTRRRATPTGLWVADHRDGGLAS